MNKTAMYVQRNKEARSCNHCSSGKTVSVTYSEYVFAALGIRNSKRMRRIVLLFGLPGSTISHKRHDFSRKKIIEPEMCDLISSIVCQIRKY
jgi:hypothetical protein